MCVLAGFVRSAGLVLLPLLRSVGRQQHGCAGRVRWCQDGDAQHCWVAQGALALLRTVPHRHGGAEIPGNGRSGFTIKKDPSLQGEAKGSCSLTLTVTSSPRFLEILCVAGIHISLEPHLMYCCTYHFFHACLWREISPEFSFVQEQQQVAAQWLPGFRVSWR